MKFKVEEEEEEKRKKLRIMKMKPTLPSYANKMSHIHNMQFPKFLNNNKIHQLKSCK